MQTVSVGMAGAQVSPEQNEIGGLLGNSVGKQNLGLCLAWDFMEVPPSGNDPSMGLATSMPARFMSEDCKASEDSELQQSLAPLRLATRTISMASATSCCGPCTLSHPPARSLQVCVMYCCRLLDAYISGAYGHGDAIASL